MPRWIRVLVVALVMSGLSSLTALASHGQGSDTDSAICPFVAGNLYGNGYAHEWQQQTHDGLNWRPANYIGWKWKLRHWGLHSGPSTQYVSIVGGGPQGSVAINVTCPDSGIDGNED